MALYSGRDLIAVCGLSKGQVRRIADATGIRKIGELRFVSGFPYRAGEIPGLSADARGTWHLDSRKSGNHFLSDDFDGWVYPDGSHYSCADFPAAAAVYAASHGAATFSVPDLRGKFFKGHTQYDLARDPATGNTYGLLEEVPMYSSEVKSHYHSINDPGASIDTSLSILSGFVFCAAGNAGKKDRSKVY